MATSVVAVVVEVEQQPVPAVLAVAELAEVVGVTKAETQRQILVVEAEVPAMVAPHALVALAPMG